MIILKYLKAIFLASDYPIPNEHDKVVIKRFWSAIIIAFAVTFICSIGYLVIFQMIIPFFTWFKNIQDKVLQLIVAIVVIYIPFLFTAEIEPRNKDGKDTKAALKETSIHMINNIIVNLHRKGILRLRKHKVVKR